MADLESNVTLIWAHTPQRWLAFRQLGMAGIDFGVDPDLSSMPEDEVVTTLQELELSLQVISEFNRLLHHTKTDSWVVSSVPKSAGWANRKWIIGKVVGGYRYRPNLRHDRHTIQVEWGSRDYTEDEITGMRGQSVGTATGGESAQLGVPARIGHRVRAVSIRLPSAYMEF